MFVSDFIFWTVYWLFKAYLRVFRALKIYGQENIPKAGPIIIAGNHTSNFDPPTLGVCVPRKTRFMAKAELFKNSFVGWFVRQLGAYPIDRGKADLEAVKTSIKIVRDGGALVIFPEGTRRKPGNLGKAQPGIVMIALRAKAPIIPCAMTNSGGGKVIVRFGEPISLEQYFDRKLTKEETEEVGAMIMEHIAKLLEMDEKFRK